LLLLVDKILERKENDLARMEECMEDWEKIRDINKERKKEKSDKRKR